MLSSVLLLLLLGQEGDAASPVRIDAAVWSQEPDVVYGYKDGIG